MNKAVEKEPVYNIFVIRGAKSIKPLKQWLEECGYYDSTRSIQQPESGSEGDSDPPYALPITQSSIPHLQSSTHPHAGRLAYAHLPLSKKSRAKRNQPQQLLRDSIRTYLEQFRNKYSSEEIDALLSDLPSSWERHGDLIVLPGNSFTNPKWTQDQHLRHTDISTGAFSTSCSSPSEDNCSLPRVIAKALKCERLAIDNKVLCDQFRSSGAALLLGQDGWVTHTDNGVQYVFDVTKCMFSSGNISEKLRVAKLDCRGETVVDLYAGIGYFTLPYLVHAGAAVVHACEWNPNAVEALERGLLANGVRERCVIHHGDNRQLSLVGVADRVNLGLVPSSEAGWPVACRALNKSTGGWLHVHGNVSSKQATGRATEHNPWEPISPSNGSASASAKDSRELTLFGESASTSSRVQTLSEKECHALDKGSSSKSEIWWLWAEYVKTEITALLSQDGYWKVSIEHLEHVKSYAPHVDHIVVDLHCRPL